MKNEHSFVKQFLKRNKIKLFIDDKQILNKNIPSFRFPEFKTKLEVNKDLTETSENIQEINYSDLNKLGFMIISERITGNERWRHKQGVRYRITRLNPSYRDYNQIPQDHYIDMDNVYKKIILYGPNAGPRGVGSWIHLTRNKPSKQKLKNHSELSDFLRSSLNPLKAIEKKEFIDVPEIPVMITEAGELVCIDPFSKNPPCIGAIGTRGGGKSLGPVHNIADNIFHKELGMQYHLNDRRNLFIFWSKLQTHKPFLKENELINHQPIRLPIIPLYPNTSDLNELAYEEEGISFRVSVPFKNFAKEITYWTQRIKHFNLPPASLTVFRDLLEEHSELSECKTRVELMKGLNDFIDVEKNKKLFDALTRRLNDVFNQQFLDISSGVHSKWVIERKNKKKNYFPPTACMLSGLIPIIMTGHLFRKEYYPQFLRWIQETIIDDLTNKVFGENRVWAFYDEIQDIIKRGKVNTVASESIIESITAGRNINLASVWNTQTYNKLDTDIKTNTTHLFCFPTHNKDDLAEIKSSYGLPQKFVNNIKHGKNLHCVAIAGDSDFTIYSPDETKPFKDDSPQFGRIIPSMSFHKPPSYMEEGN